MWYVVLEHSIRIIIIIHIIHMSISPRRFFFLFCSKCLKSVYNMLLFYSFWRTICYGGPKLLYVSRHHSPWASNSQADETFSYVTWELLYIIMNIVIYMYVVMIIKYCNDNNEMRIFFLHWSDWLLWNWSMLRNDDNKRKIYAHTWYWVCWVESHYFCRPITYQKSIYKE